jgi:hypothetical protein
MLPTVCLRILDALRSAANPAYPGDICAAGVKAAKMAARRGWHERRGSALDFGEVPPLRDNADPHARAGQKDQATPLASQMRSTVPRRPTGGIRSPA